MGQRGLRWVKVQPAAALQRPKVFGGSEDPLHWSDSPPPSPTAFPGRPISAQQFTLPNQFTFPVGVRSGFRVSPPVPFRPRLPALVAPVYIPQGPSGLPPRLPALLPAFAGTGLKRRITGRIVGRITGRTSRGTSTAPAGWWTPTGAASRTAGGGKKKVGRPRKRRSWLDPNRVGARFPCGYEARRRDPETPPEGFFLGRRPRRRRHWPQFNARYRLTRRHIHRKKRWVHPKMGAMNRWFKKVARTWRLQRQRQWLQKKRKGEVGVLVPYHMSAAKYQPRLDRQVRQRRLRRGSVGGSPPAISAAAVLPMAKKKPEKPRYRVGHSPSLLPHRPPQPETPGRRRNIQRLGPKPGPTQKGRFVWSEKKHPLLLAPLKLKRRQRKQRVRWWGVRLRRYLGGSRPRSEKTFLLPQPGATNIPRERLRRWQRASFFGRRFWWLLWRERERWYWRLCRWAGMGNKGPHKRPSR